LPPGGACAAQSEQCPHGSAASIQGTGADVRARTSAIRYAVVGLGHIAQVAVLPAFAHARRNSRLVAIVSDDRTKRREIAKRYKIDHAFTYAQFDECLRLVDAVYIALPNSMHAEYTVRAARAGVHVLCEKPMAVTVAECRQMIAACRKADVKLMIAYRLHFEAINLAALELARRGRLGELKFFNSSFSMTVRRGDIRTRRVYGGGTLYDIGVYCINAARNLFRAEPTHVSAVSVNSGVASLAEIDETTAATLRFGADRVATFVTSFNAADVGAYRLVGTKGHLHADPAYEYAEGLSYTVTIDGRTTRRKTGKRDQFAAEFSTSRTAFCRIVFPNRPAKKGCRTSGLSRRSTARHSRAGPSPCRGSPNGIGRRARSGSLVQA
jgi:glucose-fructose oxidoreductase